MYIWYFLQSHMFKICKLNCHQVGELYWQIPSSNHLLLPSHPAAHDFPAGLNNKEFCLKICSPSLARQGERVRDREVFFLSLTQGGRWRTFKDWCKSFHQKFTYVVKNLHILVLRWGMSTLVWNLTGWSGLESLTTRFLKFLLFGLSLIIIISWDFATNTTWWTRAWCWTSHQMWRIKRASIVPILSK